MPYVTRPRKRLEDDGWEPSITATVVHEIENETVDTGLLDNFGRPIYRVPERCKMGFVK